MTTLLKSITWSIQFLFVDFGLVIMYPQWYVAVVIVGLMLTAIISYVRGFLSFNYGCIYTPSTLRPATSDEYKCTHVVSIAYCINM